MIEQSLIERIKASVAKDIEAAESEGFIPTGLATLYLLTTALDRLGATSPQEEQSSQAVKLRAGYYNRWVEFHTATGLPYIEIMHHLGEDKSFVQQRLKLYDAWLSDPPREEVKVHPSTGMMLAFFLDKETAGQLAIPGGEPAEDLYLTLAFMGDAREKPSDDLLRPHTSPEPIKEAIVSITRGASPLTGHIAGIGRFLPAETDESPIIALVDLPGLNEFRAALVKSVEEAGYFVDFNHSFTPHITLASIPKDASMPVEIVPPLALRFYTVWLCVGDDRIPFRLGGDDEQAHSQEAAEEETEAGNSTDYREASQDDGEAGNRRQSLASTARDEDQRQEMAAADGGRETDDPGELGEVARDESYPGAIREDDDRQDHGAFSAQAHTHVEDASQCESGEIIQGRGDTVTVSTAHIISKDTATPGEGKMIHWQDANEEVQLHLAELQSRGVKRIKWRSHVESCDFCQRNDQQIVTLGERFLSGAVLPPEHGNCECIYEEEPREDDSIEGARDE
jgi:2'-5' RNA ligase